MMKKILIAVSLALLSGIACAGEPSSIAGAYVVTTNTTTFVSVGTAGRHAYLYNPGSYEINIATASTSVAANRFSIKAATVFPCPIDYNGQLYAIATDTNSVTLDVFIVR